MADILASEQTSEFSEVFHLYSQNSQDSLPISKLPSAMKSIGLFPKQSHINEIVNKTDPEGSGFITLPDFLNSMSSHLDCCWANPEDEIKETFEFFDENDDGLLSITEVREVLKKTADSGLNDEEIENLVRKGNCDEEGNINLEEFKKIFLDFY
jgi:Ca2+-binding EF-hand superfamily protein